MRRTAELLTAALVSSAFSGPTFADVPSITHGEFAKVQSGANDMFWHWRRNNNLTIELYVEHATTLTVMFNAGVRLNPSMPRMSVYAISIGLRGPQETNDWSAFSDPFASRPPEIPGAFVRENVLPSLRNEAGYYDRHKYGHAAIATMHHVEPGYYRVEVWSRARSTYNQGSLPFEEPPYYALPPSQIPPGERGAADGNVRFEFDPYDAYGATQPQNHLTVKLD